MPPKKKGGGGGPSKKSEQKEKKKIIEDKTFGLKNKNKSAKVNKYVQQVQSQVMASGNPKKKKEEQDRKLDLERKKELERQKKEELNELFKPVQAQQKVPFGTDPKTVLCMYFKSGTCQKGDKCKFSHDLNIERKSTKIDLYTDARDKENDTMENWDQTKLEEVVNSKHGKPQTTTDIVCKFFLEAIENRKYGWFWTCPNGGPKCKYRHALPPGFELKAKKNTEEKEEEISLEEFLESERHKLGSNLTPVTYESFQEWKRNRLAIKEAEDREAQEKKAAAYRAGGKNLIISGRELFTYNPDLVDVDDDEDGAQVDYSAYRQNEEDNQEYDNDGEQEEAPIQEELFEGEDLDDLDIDDDDE